MARLTFGKLKKLCESNFIGNFVIELDKLAQVI